MLDFILTILLGWAGYWKFRNGKILLGLIWIITCGGFGIGWLCDIIFAFVAFLKTLSATPSHSPAPAPMTPPRTPPRPILHPINPVVTPPRPVSPSANNLNNNNTITVPKPPEIADKRYLRYYYDDVGIYTTIDNFDNISIGKWIEMIQEPENEYDSNAIKIVLEGRHLGYIYKGTLQKMCNKYISSDNNVVIGKITKIDHLQHKIYIYLAFYNEITKDMIEKTFTVTVSENKYYENCLDEGYDVDISYDYEDDKFTIDDWGKVPKSAQDFFESIQGDDKYVSYIEKVTENESGSCKVKISTFRK